MDELTSADLEAVDALVASYAQRGAQPGIAYGIVAGGALVHSGGLGERWLGGPAPDAGTVFRIASMTKSFTAATVLSLRDEGALRLDDLAQDHVAELGALRLPSTDSPRPTIRNLLTMTAGFPTDDPWGDRQQGLDPAEFAALLAAAESGSAGRRAPGSSTPTWATRCWARSSRRSPAPATRTPSGAGSWTRWAWPTLASRPASSTRRSWPAATSARRGLGRAAHRPYGAFAPMGGVFSTVADLARWAAGFADAFPARDGAQTAGTR